MICTIHPTCPIGATHAAHPNCSIYPAHCSPYLHCLPTHLIDTTPLGLPHLHLLLHFCLTHLVCTTKSPHSHCQPYPSYLHHLHCSLLLLCQLPIVMDSVKYHPVRSGYSLRNLSISHT